MMKSECKTKISLTFSVNYSLSLNKTVAWGVSLSELNTSLSSQLFQEKSWSFLLCTDHWDECVQLTVVLGRKAAITWFDWRLQQGSTQSSVVSWRAEPLCDNRPDGQRTGKAWPGKQHVTPTEIFVCLSLFVLFSLSVSPCQFPLKCYSQIFSSSLGLKHECMCQRFISDLLIWCCRNQ